MMTINNAIAGVREWNEGEEEAMGLYVKKQNLRSKLSR